MDTYHEKNYEKLDNATGPDGFWKDGSHVFYEVELFFNNVSLVLRPDGTYSLGDESGG